MDYGGNTPLQSHCPACGYHLRSIASVVETPLDQNGREDPHRLVSKYTIVQCAKNPDHQFKAIGSGLYGMGVRF